MSELSSGLISGLFTRQTYASTHARTHPGTCTQATSPVGESETLTHVLTQYLDLPLHEVITNSRRINRVCNIILIVCVQREKQVPYITETKREANKKRKKKKEKKKGRQGGGNKRRGGVSEG